MAVIGTLEVIRSQLGTHPGFEDALAYAEESLLAGSEVRARIDQLESGQTVTVPLTGGVFAMDQVYQTKTRAEGRWEAHNAHIDVQVIVSGAEYMAVTDRSTLKVSEDLTPAKDVLFFEDVPTSSMLHVPAGSIAVFFPEDAHMPCLSVDGVSTVRKTVIKVPVLV